MGAFERSETECKRVRGGACVYALLKDCIGVDAKRVDGLISFKEKKPLFFFSPFQLRELLHLLCVKANGSRLRRESEMESSSAFFLSLSHHGFTLKGTNSE